MASGRKLLLGLLLMCFISPSLAGEKTVVGWVENVRLSPGQITIPAKLDTGAESCSLDAANISPVTRQGQEWVRFEVNLREGQTITLERPMIRTATIKRHIKGPQIRPVVKLGICLGGVYKEAEVNLVDRQKFQYPMLIGRKFLEGSLIIDPARKFTVEPHCAE